MLLGYGYLVGLLLLTAASSLIGFFRLSEGIEAVLEDNFTSIQATMTMLDALERLDSALLTALAEPTAFDDSEDDRFLEALAQAEANVTEESEPAILARIREEFGGYRSARRHLLEDPPERPRSGYEREVFPRFARTKRAVGDLLEVNQTAMFEADRESRRSALRNGTWIGLLVAIALVSMILLARALQDDLLRRLENLSTDLATFGRGESQLRLVPEGHDELAAIATHVNQILDRHEGREARVLGRLGQEKRLVLALLELAGPDAVLLDRRGRRLTGAASVPAALEELLREAIASAPPADDSGWTTTRLADATWELRGVLGRAAEPIAWVARPARPSGRAPATPVRRSRRPKTAGD
jgi:hypothetical protein